MSKEEDAKVSRMTMWTPDGKELTIMGDLITAIQPMASGLPMVTYKLPSGGAARIGGLPFRIEFEAPSLVKAVTTMPRLS